MSKHVLKVKGKEIDAKVGIVEICTVHNADGKDYWAYLVVPPTKYEEFKKRQLAGESLKLPEWGEVLRSGEGKAAPDEIKREMEEIYGVDHGFQKKLEEALIAELKKRQGNQN